MAEQEKEQEKKATKTNLYDRESKLAVKNTMWLHKEFILIVNSLEATSVYLYGWQNIQRHLLLVPIENTFLSYFIPM